MDNSRRDFIKKSGIVSLGFLGLNQFLLGCTPGFSTGFGPLAYKEGDILSLPKGFSAKVISKKGDLMSDGLFSPGNHDGMGLFKWKNDKVMLIRNHEITPGSYDTGPFGEGNALIHKIDKNKIYDYASGGNRTCVGGTTTLIYNEKTQEVEQEHLSLIGTIRNCSGGVTPWNSWVTCEETADKAGGEDGKLEKDHGYNFEVAASDRIVLADPNPIKAMGRFVHESLAFHPDSGIVYQTEDEGDGLIYRYLPEKKGDLHKGGKLQCLALLEWKAADTRNYKNSNSSLFPEKKRFKVYWIDLDQVESPDGDLRKRGYKLGAAIFSSGEGMSFGKGELFFTASSGGLAGRGQIFKYTPSRFEGRTEEKNEPGFLELFIESKDEETFRYCDNITVAPWGDVVICEDCIDPRIIGITPQGHAYVIAKNIGYSESEFAGPVFSPSGKTLFVNIQTPGLTLAITGPWNV